MIPRNPLRTLIVALGTTLATTTGPAPDQMANTLATHTFVGGRLVWHTG